MKTTIIAVACLVLAAGSVRAQAPPPSGAIASGGARLQLDSLDRLASLASDVVDISIDPGMLKLASAFLKGTGEEAAVKAMLSELKGIYVKTFEFDRDAVTPADLDPIRRQLASPGWARLVTVDSKRDRQTVEIYSWREGDTSGGLAILVAEPTELTVVNIVGPIDLEKLGALEGQFGIPRLPAPASPPTP